MYLLTWIIIGSISGWLIRNVLEERAYGPLVAVVSGIAGATSGGLIMRFAGSPFHQGLTYTTLAALLGAETLSVMISVFATRKELALS
jgi:uncharacterized membrane protein YeaQ/YmgE (transglycosylase-associated protein family)